MKLAGDVSRRQTQTLPLAACILLLLVRLALPGNGQLRIALLGLMYISVLGLSRPRVYAPLGRALVPLGAGAMAIVSVWLVLARPSTVPATTTGLFLSVLAAVAEEAFFRGALFDHLQPYGQSTAMLISALAFALVHLPLYGIAAFPLDFGAGLLFSWQRSESDSWAVPAATHALANVLAVVR